MNKQEIKDLVNDITKPMIKEIKDLKLEILQLKSKVNKLKMQSRNSFTKIRG